VFERFAVTDVFFGVVILYVAMPGFWRFVAGLSSRMPEFDIRPVDKGFVVDKVA
jgi:hypothetical protein